MSLLKTVPKNVHIVLAIGLVMAASSIYSNTLKSPFLLDDYGNIVGNAAIEIKDFSLSSLIQAWSGPHITRDRNVAYLSFALNYLVGGYNSYGYHLVNIGIHIGCALLVFLFFYQTLNTGWLKTQYAAAGRWLAWIAALIWLFHPIQINAVTYIVQRMTSLAVLFALISMSAWLAGRSVWLKHRRVHATGYWVLAFGSWCLGLFSKEHVAIVPVLIVMHEIFLLRRGAFFRIKWKWLFLGIAIMIVPAVIYLGIDPIHRILSGYAKRDFTLSDRLLTESRVLWHYISLFFYPASERFSLFYEFPLSRGFFSPITTCLSLIAWACVILLAWIYRKEYPVFSWMTAWFLSSHMIESTVIPLEIIFEHRMYLPSIGLALGAVLIGYDFFQQRRQRFTIPILIVSSWLCILSIATYTRNMDFKDEVTLYRSELQKFPDSSRNQIGLALALNAAGRLDEGGHLLEEMASKHPHDFVIQQNWYNFMVRARYGRSVTEGVYRNLVSIINNDFYNYHHDAIALKNLAELLFEQGDYSRALFMLDRLLMNYRHGSFFLLKGICHDKRDEWLSAKQAFYEAWKRDPQNINMVFWYGKSMISSGEKETGCRFVMEAVQKSTGDKKVRLLCQKMLEIQCYETN